ncbi:MAG: UDP-N-acetylmuramoyl-L-alanyl-D-glutamate--2,6-diaminopimelate ligase [Pseudomonadota bacterium]
MRLHELIREVESCELHGSADVEVCDIAYRASEAKAGSCFVAIRGTVADGHDFAADAVERGAVAVVSERPAALGGAAVNVVVKNSRQALARMSAALFGNPSKAIKLVGVTGTSGKTTTTYLLESIFESAGLKAGVIGTVEYKYGGIREIAPHTTPESYELQRLLSRMKERGVAACAMEVSSHALDQNRVDACHFDCAVFTNLTPEHLDYHADMDSYFAAKATLFEDVLSRSAKSGVFAAINAGDPRSAALADCCKAPVVLYGLDGDFDVRGTRVSSDAGGLKMRVDTPQGSFDCSSRLCGRFNAENILAAVAVAGRMGIGIDAMRAGLASAPVVPGRFEAIANSRRILALVDYAHKPDALEKVLSCARELVDGDGGRLIVVFGCGGDRDRGKRPLMGRTAARFADIAIVTSDNPRTEDPAAIIDEIMPGVKDAAHPLKDGRGYEVIPDRRGAIVRAVEIAKRGDVVIVAGKGHEDYQIIGTKKIPFDDREILRELLA